MSKIAYMFCGGGAQYPGMMRDLYREIPECRRVFDEADERLKKHLYLIRNRKIGIIQIQKNQN